MTSRHFLIRALRAATVIASLTLVGACNNSAHHSATPATSDVVVDDYFGTKVSDRYRWLEDADSPRTVAFVEEQNQRARDFIDGPTHQQLKVRLTELLDYPRYSAPSRHGSHYVYSLNQGLQNQPVMYVEESLAGPARVLIDPNTLSPDGTVAVSGASYTEDGTLLAYGLASAGSDQKEIGVRRVSDATDLPDHLKWCKFANVAWKHDNSGFWYNRYPDPATVAKEDQAKNNRLYWHKLGTPQSDDPVVYERPDDRDISMSPSVTDDGEYLLLYLSRGSASKNRLYYRKADFSGGFVKLFDAEDSRYSFVEHDGPIFYIQTDLDAPRMRIVAVDIRRPAKENWKEIIPQSRDTISSVNVVNNQFLITYLTDAHDVLKLYNLDGTFVKEIAMPGIGNIGGANGKRTDKESFITFSSFVYPPTIFRYDFAAGKLELLRKSQVRFDPQRYQTTQVFVPSRDGTKIPMFITCRKDLSLDGNNPTILNGYGGFNVSLTPTFNATRIPWLEAGGVFAVANLRGGGEYGEEWHKSGMQGKKQNVFDDFQSCARWLCQNGYSSTKKLAIEGGSNGGLLVAACETQWPDLFGAVVCHVPLTDMLRFHRFSVGRFWVPEYGRADESARQFKWLMAYSPYQNVKPGTVYPPTLVLTANHDDRVVPLHARKFVAALQADSSGDNPILLRTETRAGHGGGKPTTKQIDENADVYAFLAKVFDMKFPKTPEPANLSPGE
ncbi:MAG: prolyl oligopeptidase family serine peptidase [Tepidisphaeraceae bacterium]